MTLSPAALDRARQRFEVETSLIAHAVATRACEEVSRYLATRLPRQYVLELIDRTHTAYARSRSFRQSLVVPDDDPRPEMYACMRRWLAARLQRERPRLFRRLPASYARGHPLPPPPPWIPKPCVANLLSNDARLLLPI